MLDLYAGVHFHEVEVAAGIDQKLQSAGILIANRFGSLDRGTQQVLARFLGKIRRRGLLDQFLVSALQRAVPLTDRVDVTEHVAQHLHLDVSRLVDKALDIDIAGTEIRLGFLLGDGKEPRQFAFAGHHTHPTSATTSHCLDQRRVSNTANRLFGGRQITHDTL